VFKRRGTGIALWLFRLLFVCTVQRSIAPKTDTESVLSWREKCDFTIPNDRRILLLGDTEYACREVVRGLPERIVFVGPMSMDAALYAPPPTKHKGRGRPRVKGSRLIYPKRLQVVGISMRYECREQGAKVQEYLWYFKT